MLRRSEEAKFMPGVWVFPGGSLDAADGAEEAGLRACALRELAEEAGIELPAGEELVLFSRWITPEVIATRFDAWFFLALAPAHTPPQPDGVETTEARWFQPAAALEAHDRRRGRPLLPDPDPAPLAGRVPHLRRGDRRLPRAHVRADPAGGDRRRRRRTRVVLPGDPDYPA